jgi:hypothetical protein
MHMLLHGHSTLWMMPVLVGQFEFVEWTADGHLRHSRWLCCENSKKKTGLRFASRSVPFSVGDSEQHAHEPRLAGRIFLC